MNDIDRTGPFQAASATPERIGRYRIKRMLGKGGFGIVYLAHDEQLQRLVAIKVPHARLISRPEDADAYLTEARTVANLDHPNIVPVHDVGSNDEFPCFVVSKYIEGSTLSQKIKENRPSVSEAVELVATIAETLHYAHRIGLVHRDIKPGNILLDKSGKPYVADFGLALKEEDFGKGATFAGTPAYMSPEQARGEGHRVDGRSDIFSLGVVLYELLTGRRPFHADSREELLEQITNREVRPPRQWDDTIPKELERICLKALSKRASDRYTTAKDMGDDLRHFLAEKTINQQSSPVGKGSGSPGVMPVMQPPKTVGGSGTLATPATPTSDHQLIKIVPKGLRSFDAHDADFFLELLPGPHDRDGLPDSIRFWKTRIEEMDAEQTFSVGLIYGPSGCGKSSLVKAGLLPRLSENVITVYIEATAGETETRLLNGLRKRCLALPDTLSLKETMTALRHGQGIPVGKKVLIVLDQFEQWLHAKKEEENTELVQALRQCDGGRMQCVVMVRVDFWLAVSRFMQALEIRVLEGENSRLVDLFDTDHARKVLTAYGRAFGKLPESSGETSKEQKDFLKQAVSGLSQEGKVICVRLALFAEMMKGKSWTPASLNEVGGTEGVGVTFLEETFGVVTAPPEHRYHQKAARADLKVLLPDTGSDLKGHMRSYAELLEASGYGSRPKDFDDLIRILDNEIRLITPTDPEGKEVLDTQAQRGQKYYQLTHDYLVHSIREWLTRKQKETRRGRAELLLADRAAVWNARPENRQLPSLLQWFQIKWLTAKKNWTPPQRKMMTKAGKYHSVRGLMVTVLLAVVTFAGLVIRDQVEEKQKETHAVGLVQAVLNADTVQVPDIIGKMTEYRKWTDPLLQEEYAKATDNSPQKLNASLALLPVDAMQVDYLFGQLLDAKPQEVSAIRDALAPHKDKLLDKLWAVVEKPEKEKQRLRAASALAKYDADSEKWEKVGEAVVGDLVTVPAVYLSWWTDALRPVRVKLLGRLTAIYSNASLRETSRSLATDILADYAADQPQVLADLLMKADEKQFAVIYPKLKDRGKEGLSLLIAEIDKKLPSDLPSSDDSREKLAKRQTNAAVALLRMNQSPTVWPLLKHSDDPRVRSYLIHKLSPLGADAKTIVNQLAEEKEITIRRALVQCLGKFSEKKITLEDRKNLLPKLQEIYRTEDDPGLHASTEWLLRTWEKDEWLQQENAKWAKNKEQRDKRLEGIRRVLVKEKEKSPPQWYVNTQGQTMVVLPGPVTFSMGSPKAEKGRSVNEVQHRRRIGRTFAIASKSVTLEQYRSLTKDPYKLPHEKYGRYPDCPVSGINWYMAAAYCNLLSKEEGIDKAQWCYETDFSGQVTGLKANYLSLTGYRLPTEAEMEYATRAGSVTSRYYGETEELLGNYAWYTKNSNEVIQRVGMKKPNDFGLFDVQGNCFTWCQEILGDYPKMLGDEAVEDKEEPHLVIKITVSPVMRGGSFIFQASGVRSASRGGNYPRNRNASFGFRVARTFTP